MQPVSVAKPTSFFKAIALSCAFAIVATNNIGSSFAAAPAPPAPVVAAPPPDVNTMIDSGKAFLYSKMTDDNWETVPNPGPNAAGAAAQWGGTTALVTYALLAAGESPQEPHLVKSIAFLRRISMGGIYALGIRSQVWLNVPKSTENNASITKDTKLLLAARNKKGMFHYTNGGPNGGYDHSTAQYGLLGLWASSETVEGIPDTFWADADKTWRADQGSDGSWTYGPVKSGTEVAGKVAPGTATMTAAGVATLFITQDFLYRNKGLECTGNIVDPNISLGLKWMSDHFKEVFAGGFRTYYGLYGIERIGVASGYRYFGNVDWFREGAAFLAKVQAPAGKPNAGAIGGDVMDTSFSLLFLARGRAPVMMNKLQYDLNGKEANWNERPRDVFNIEHWVGEKTENTLNWQITDLKVPVEDWHDAPILYISGNQALNFTPEDKAKLKLFVEQGGIILGNADCGKKEFSDSFRKLGIELFKNYEFKPVPLTHPLMQNQQFEASKWKKKPTVLGMDNGARMLMLLIPDADPSKAWQLVESAGREELFQLAANIFLYAVDKSNLSNKGETYIITPDPRVKPTATIDVARINYQGNWDPEPGGWRRLSAKMHNEDSIDVNAVDMDPGKTPLTGKKIAHLTGTGPFTLSVAAINALKTFVSEGGFLIVDSAGGDAQFAQAAEKQLRAIYGDDASQLTQPLSEDDALYAVAGPLDVVKYRAFARTVVGNSKSPRLRGITKAGKLICVYSPEDLSVGLVGQPVDGIIGYDPATSSALMRKILLMASGAKPVTPPKPAAVATPTTKPAVKAPVKKSATKPAAKPKPKTPTPPPTPPADPAN